LAAIDLSETRLENGRDPAVTGGGPLASARPAVAPYQSQIDLFSNPASWSVFDLSVVHLHPLIAPHIITKFFA